MNKFKILLFTVFLLGVLFNVSNSFALFNYSNSFLNSNPYPKNIFPKKSYTNETIIPKGVRDLKYNPGGILQNDGTFLFKSAEVANSIDHYMKITGTNDNNIVRFKGRFIIDQLDLFGGKNTLKIESGSEFIFHPHFPTKVGLEIINVSDFIIEHGVKIEALKPKYGAFDMNITFTSVDSSDVKNDIILDKFSMYGSNENVKGTININNAKVNIKGTDKVILTNHDETINLKDAKLDKDNNLDIKTISTLILGQGMSKPGGNNVINMGKYSKIIVSKGMMEVSGIRNTINMNIGSNIQGQLVFRNGEAVINVLGSNKDTYLNDINKININSIIFGNGKSYIYINDYANFDINHGLSTGKGVINIFVGKGSIFTSKDGIKILGEGSNYIKLEEQSTVNGSIEFNKSLTHNNKIIINTGNSFVTLNGSLTGSGNNDKITLLGEGILKVNAEPGTGLDGFNSLNLGRSRIEFDKFYRQTVDSNIFISLRSDTKNEDSPRFWFHGLSLFEKNNLNIHYNGVSKYLSKVGEKYSLVLIRNGRKGEGFLPSLEEIGIKSINFNSALYKLDHAIEGESDLRLNLVKYRTFEQAVSEHSRNSEKDEYITQMGNYLDRLLEIKNLKEEYYDILDTLAMLDIENLRNTLVGYLPINNVVLFNINKNISSDFRQFNINKSPYKIFKNDLSLWSNVSYSKIDLSNNKTMGGAKAKSTNFIFGAEYSFYKFLKLGVNIGYTKPNISGDSILYTGTSNQYYYGVYSNIVLTNNLTSNINIGYLNSNYNLTRTPLNMATIYSNPKFKQTDLDIVFLYKLKLNKYLLSPFVSFTYSNAKMSPYNENGLLVRSIDSSKFNEFKSGLGVKALVVQPLNTVDVVIPSISLGLYNSFQSVQCTNIHTSVDDVPIKFYSKYDYGGITANGTLNISYLFKNSVTLDFNVGASLNKNITSFNLGLSANFLF